MSVIRFSVENEASHHELHRFYSGLPSESSYHHQQLKVAGKWMWPGHCLLLWVRGVRAGGRRREQVLCFEWVILPSVETLTRNLLCESSTQHFLPGVSGDTKSGSERTTQCIRSRRPRQRGLTNRDRMPERPRNGDVGQSPASLVQEPYGSGWRFVWKQKLDLNVVSNCQNMALKGRFNSPFNFKTWASI